MITFGTDGWRDVIADNFTFSNVRLATQAVADYVLETHANPVLVVGYDTRFLSRRFAETAASVLAANRIRVFFTDNFVPTPAVSLAVSTRKTQGGIVITASHNPAKYNGFKFKAPYGGSATPEIMASIESRYRENVRNGKQPRLISFDQGLEEGTIEIFNPEGDYFAKIRSLLDLSLFQHSSLRVVVDPLYGVGQGYFQRLLDELGCQVKEIHGRIFPTFGGLNPEPIEANLDELKKAVIGGYDLGLALDGDADRIGAVDEQGNFVDSHQIFSLILKHLVEERHWRGKVVKTVSTTQMVDRLAKKYSLPLVETPIGFKYICDHILADDVLIGGEESGGISIRGYIPERDGLLMGCLIAEVMLARKKRLSELLADLSAEVGPSRYLRVDEEMAATQKDRAVDWLKMHDVEAIEGRSVVKKNLMDGFKFFFEGDSWLLLRPSGTEPVVRVYAEASNRQEVESLVAAGVDLLRRAAIS